jgi:hypothetical protein
MKRQRLLPSTIPRSRPPKRAAMTHPPRMKPEQRPDRRGLPRPAVHQPRPRAVGLIMDDGEKSLVDVLDSLLNQGVVLNADVILALANVDLVYLRLSALLCAADRVLAGQTV